MPQFDTFSFFSQIFWVLLLFTLLYLSLAYYLLPAIATTLKVRKRKLSVQGSGAQGVAVTGSLTGFNTQVQTLDKELNSELLGATQFGVSTEFPFQEFLITNERNKNFSSKFYSCFLGISLFSK